MFKYENRDGDRLLSIGIIWLFLDLFGVKAGAIAMKHFIFIREMFWYDIKILAHERAHLPYQKEMGWFKYVWKHFTDKEFQFQMEVVGHAAEVRAGQLPSKAVKNLYENYSHEKSKAECAIAISLELSETMAP